MNSLVKELVNRAMVVREDGWSEFDVEKFAQLIAKDAIHQAALIAVSNFQNEDVCWTVKTLTTALENRYDLK